VSEFVYLVAALVFCLAQSGVCIWYVGRIEARGCQRETELLRMIKSLENKLSAKDIQGYIALQAEDAVKAAAKAPDRSDVGEAELEARRFTGSTFGM
jgi:hypothetical protein